MVSLDGNDLESSPVSPFQHEHEPVPDSHYMVTFHDILFKMEEKKNGNMI